MKISEIKILKKVNRPTNDQDGNRIYKEVEFELDYDPTIKNDLYRLFAKIIDIAVVMAVMVLLYKNEMIEINTTFYVLPLVLILLNSILESVIGSSIGKLIFWMEVVDDECKHLNLLKSIERNAYSFLLIFSMPIVRHFTAKIIEYYDRKMSEKCIYVISKRKKPEILKLMNSK